MARIPPKTVSKDDAEVLAQPRDHAEARGLRPGRARSRRSPPRSSSPAPACATPRSRSAPTSSPARPASARPRSQSSSPLSLGVELLRFDMSEYMERHTVSRLIGAPPGYVGFDQGGLLTDGIDQHPHCVLLLDEIEKAHPDLFNILLQVMDHGKLTDHNGKQVDFRNVIIIMTTNAGAADLAQVGLRLHAEQARGRRHRGDQPAVRAGVPQPSRRRDLVRAGCRSEVVAKVVDKFVMQLEAQLADRNVTIELSDEARDWLVRARLRRDHGRAADGAADPGDDQDAARRRGAVRPAQDPAARCASSC